MRVPSPVVHFVTGTAALAMLAGCSGAGGGGVNATPVAANSLSGAVVQTSTRSSACASTHVASRSSRFWYPGKPTHPTRVVNASMNAMTFAKNLTTTQRVVVVADAANGVLDAFDYKGTQIGELTGFSSPDGLASDTRGDLFVADSGNDRIVVVHNGVGSTILSEPGNSPSGVDSFHNGGVVAAANFGDQCAEQGGVTFFVHGALKKTIISPSLASAWFCAFDANGNLYVDGLDENDDPTVGEIVGGVRGTSFTPLTFTNSVMSFVGIQVTANGQIAIADQAGAVYTYNPPSSGSLGAPVSTTVLAGTTDPIGFAFTKHRAMLYAGDAGGGALEQFRYPGGTAMRSIPIAGTPIGIAIFPSDGPRDI